MVKIVKAPEPIPDGKVLLFLAGAIDMGEAEDWQAKVTNELAPLFNNEELVILNPRRDKWTVLNQQDLEEQIQWELDAQEKADIIYFHFPESSKAPITLLELGLALREQFKQVVIYCHKDFYRATNVKITSEYYQTECFLDNNQAINILIETIKIIYKIKNE